MPSKLPENSSKSISLLCRALLYRFVPITHFAGDQVSSVAVVCRWHVSSIFIRLREHLGQRAPSASGLSHSARAARPTEGPFAEVPSGILNLIALTTSSAVIRNCSGDGLHASTPVACCQTPDTCFTGGADLIGASLLSIFAEAPSLVLPDFLVPSAVGI